MLYDPEPILLAMLAARVDELEPEGVYGLGGRPGSLGGRDLIATILVNQVTVTTMELNHGSLGRMRAVWMVTLNGKAAIVQKVAYELPQLLVSWFWSSLGSVERTMMTNFVAPFSKDNSVTEARLMFRSDIGGA